MKPTLASRERDRRLQNGGALTGWLQLAAMFPVIAAFLYAIWIVMTGGH